MNVWPKTSKARKISLALLLVLVLPALWFICSPIFEQPSAASLARVMVLDDADPDFGAVHPKDCVYAFIDGKMTQKVAGLNICQTVGGARLLSAAPNGRFFVACENVPNHITAYEAQTGKQLWRVDGALRSDGSMHSATVSSDGRVYALTSSGKIYGDETIIINTNGQITTRSKVGGFDLVLDERRKVLWTVSSTIKKCDLDLNVLREVSIIDWCAVSVDLNSDGSIWVAERRHGEVQASQDRLLKISADGKLLKTVALDFSPMCLRVNQSDGSFWVTGAGYRVSKSSQILRWIEKRIGHLPIGNGAREFLMRGHAWSRTDRRDPDGNLLQRYKESGHTLAIDPVDNSVWVAGYENLRHYSSDGRKLGRLRGLSDSQSYVVVLPSNAKGPHQ